MKTDYAKVEKDLLLWLKLNSSLALSELENFHKNFSKDSPCTLDELQRIVKMLGVEGLIKYPSYSRDVDGEEVVEKYIEISKDGLITLRSM